MNLPKLSINRPVLATMMSAVLILFGLISYQKIALDRFPAVEFPVISIFTSMVGADPDVIDSSITSSLETAVNAIPGINKLKSYSKPSTSLVLVQFDLDKNIDIAFNEVQAKINQTLAKLPKQAETPIVQKMEVGAQPIMWLVLQGNRNLSDLNQIANQTIKKKLETIDGVGQVLIGGEQKQAMRVELNLSRMAAFNITTQDILRAFQTEHIQVPGGFMKSQSVEHLLNLDLEYHDAQTLSQLVVAHRNGLTVTLSDIAKISDGLADKRQVAQFNGKPAVGLGIIKVNGANTVKIIDTLKQRLQEEIKPQLPTGVQLNIATDDGHIIGNIIDALKEHLFTGTLLAALVVWVFLQSIRSTLIIAVTIPVSLLGAVATMYFAGFSFNVLTLLALLLLIGVVVDDAIVVLENIHRTRMEKPELSLKEAALTGTQTVMFAVLAATLTLVSIFVPVIFLGGIIGRFFQSFAVVVTVGVLVSLFVSLTLTPMLCSYFINATHNKHPLYQKFENAFLATERFYKKLIQWAITAKWTVVVLTVTAIIFSGFIMGLVGKEFLPKIDEGRFLVNFRTPLGSNIDYTEKKLNAVEKIIKTNPAVANYFSSIGSGETGSVNEGQVFVTLKPQAERNQTQYDVINELSDKLSKLTGVVAFTSNISIVGGGRGEPLQFVILGPNLDKVSQISKTLLNKLNQIPNLGHVDLDLQLNLPQYKIEVDRTRAHSLGLTSSDIAQTLNVLAGGLNVAKYNAKNGDNERYNIRLKAEGHDITRPSDLSQIYMRGTKGDLVRLDTVAKLKPVTGPAVIFRSNLQYGSMFFSSPGIALGTAIDKIQTISKKILPPGYTLTLEGQAKEFQSTAKNMLFAFVMAITLVYMVLASQFNSYIQPLIIMVAQPLAIIGGLVALWMTGHTLNIYSMIGMVLLMGLVAKNSILLVDLTNQYRNDGLSIREALLAACPQRMRPVLMTSFTVILAMLPAAIGQGAGSDSNGPLSVAVIGGMISSTFLTLLVIPAFYLLVEEFLVKFRNKKLAEKEQSVSEVYDNY